MAVQDLAQLNGRAVLVSGAGQGVGREIALRCADHGAGAIVVNDYYHERAERVVAELAGRGASGFVGACDVSDTGAVAEMVANVTARIGRGIELLINNAGNAGPTPTDEMSEVFWKQSRSAWEGFLATNLYGVLNLTHAVLPGMIEQGYGRIVTVISDAGRVGEPGREVYSAAKAGAAGFMRAVAASTGRYGITANSVSLAVTRTPRTESRLADTDRLTKVMKKYVIRRPGEPEDAANAVVFLISDAASWITGQTLPVNGGYSFAL